MLEYNWGSTDLIAACDRLRTADNEPDECEDCSAWLLEAWERQTQGGVSVSAEYRNRMEKIGLVRGLMERGLAEHQRVFDLAMDKAEADFALGR